jgi:PAS domain S-box-containing protein
VPEDSSRTVVADAAAGNMLEIAALLDMAPVGALVHSYDGDVITYWSRGAEQLYGWTATEALGQVTHKLLRTIFPVSQADMEDSLRASGQWSGELVHTTRDGRHIVVASRMAVRRDELGRPLATLELNTDLSLHKGLESELRDTNERFRILVEAVRDYAIFLLSPDGTVLTWNNGAQRLKGYSPEDIIGQSFTRFYTTDDRERGLPRSLLERAAAEGRAEHEGWRVRKDGTQFWANVVITALRDSDGTLRGYAKITRDLTERKEGEEARARASREEGARAAAEAAAVEVRASRDQLAAILEGVTDGITVLDRSGRMLFANDAAARLCGFTDAADLLGSSGEELLGRFDLLDASGGQLPPEELPTRKALAGDTPRPALVRFRIRATGEERWSVVSSTPITTGDNGVAMAVSVFRDVTEQKRAEETARFLAAVNLELTRTLDYTVTLRRLAELAVPTLADWCVVDIVDERHQLRRLAVAHVDPVKVQLAQQLEERYPADPRSGQGVHEVVRTGRPQILSDITPDQLEAAARDDEHRHMLRELQLRSAITVPLIARGRTLGALTLVTGHSGRRYTSDDLRVAEDLAVRAALAVDNARLFREAQEQTTTQVELNEALRSTMEQLERELHTREEFLAAASHDLKNPIASIKGNAQLALRRLESGRGVGPDALRNAFERIVFVSNRAATQVDELLDNARIQMGRTLDLDKQQIDLSALVDQLVSEQQCQTDRHEFHIHSAGPSLVAVVDQRRLSRVISNLLENAVKYSPEGGSIRVELGVDETSDMAVIAVHDQGLGIPASDVERIFERFERGSNVVGHIAGTGIGLASARHIVESHGGTIGVRSELGIGSSFILRLPRRVIAETAL